MMKLEEFLLIADDPETLQEFLGMKTKLTDYVLIIEQFQKLLGVHITTDALAKVAVLMREETEAEGFIRKIRDGELHHAEHADEPCRCNEDAAAKFLNGSDISGIGQARKVEANAKP